MTKTDQNVAWPRGLIFRNIRMTICGVGNMLRTSFWSVHGTLKDNMNYVWIGAKFVFCLLFVCVNFWLKQNDCHSAPFLLARFNALWILSYWKSQGVIKGTRFSMIQAKLHNMLAKFQTMHLWKCFVQWCDHWTCCINTTETVQRATLIRRVRAVCDGEINPVHRQITPHTVALYQWHVFFSGSLWQHLMSHSGWILV